MTNRLPYLAGRNDMPSTSIPGPAPPEGSYSAPSSPPQSPVMEIDLPCPFNTIYNPISQIISIDNIYNTPSTSTSSPAPSTSTSSPAPPPSTSELFQSSAISQIISIDNIYNTPSTSTSSPAPSTSTSSPAPPPSTSELFQSSAISPLRNLRKRKQEDLLSNFKKHCNESDERMLAELRDTKDTIVKCHDETITSINKLIDIVADMAKKLK